MEFGFVHKGWCFQIYGLAPSLSFPAYLWPPD
jgi:hypothetical protein